MQNNLDIIINSLEELKEHEYITHLTFGFYFNQPLTVGVLPASITHLTFGWHFNQPLTAGVLSASITHLTFGGSFNQPLTVGVLPASITHLTFNDDFNQPLTAGILPENIEELWLFTDYQYMINISSNINNVYIWYKNTIDNLYINANIFHIKHYVDKYYPYDIMHHTYGKLYTKQLSIKSINKKPNTIKN